MKFKILSLSVASLLFFVPVNSNEIDCTKFKKLSAKYIDCNAKKLQEKTSEKVKSSRYKFKNSNFKDKLNKFKNSKTLSDLVKE